MVLIPHCGQAKIEAGSQALVVPRVDTEHNNLCIFQICYQQAEAATSCNKSVSDKFHQALLQLDEIGKFNFSRTFS